MSIGESYLLVEEKHTAKTMGSGVLPVFATPALVALMEEAACKTIEALLNENTTTVGTVINVKHLAATPIGMKVWAKATMVAQEERLYTFEIEAFDDKGLVGTAHHQRVAVLSDRFMEKTLAKKEG